MVYSNLLSINDLLNVLLLVLGNKIDTWGAVNRGRLAAAPWVLSRYGKGKPHAIDYTQEYWSNPNCRGPWGYLYISHLNSTPNSNLVSVHPILHRLSQNLASTHCLVRLSGSWLWHRSQIIQKACIWYCHSCNHNFGKIWYRVRNKIVKITRIFEQLEQLRNWKVTCWSEKNGSHWSRYPISYNWL